MRFASLLAFASLAVAAPAAYAGDPPSGKDSPAKKTPDSPAKKAEKDPAGQKPDKPAKDKAAAQAYFSEVLVLHATSGDKGIDPRIGDMPELKNPPFSSYKSYELLQRIKNPLLREDPKTSELPNGRVLQTKLIDVLPEDAVKISASINQPHGKTFLPLLEVKAKVGQSFIVAGQSYKGGILVLVIRVVK